MTEDATDVIVWRNELDALKARLGRLFDRPEPRRQAGLYLEGLLSAAKRKNGWQLAKQIGDAQPWRTQRLLSHALWDQDAARDLCRDYALEHLGHDGGVLILGETEFPKKGEHSVGVTRCYVSTTCRIGNAQTGIFLAYANDKGHALIDRELYLPQGDWCEDAGRRTQAAIPDRITFVDRQVMICRMIGRARDAGLPCTWVLGKELYGHYTQLHMALEQCRQPFVFAIFGMKKLWAVLNDRLDWHSASHLAASLPTQVWQRLSADVDYKGEQFYDWACLRLNQQQQPPWEHWLLVQRSCKDPKKFIYYVVFGFEGTTLATLARVASRCRVIDECFRIAKQDVGLADYEIRSWHGWYRHITLAMLALAFLASMRAKFSTAVP